MIHQYWQQMLMVSLSLLKIDSIPPFFNFGPEYIEHSFRFTECQSRQVLLQNPTFKMNPLPPVAPPIDDTSLTHVMRLAAHSTTSQTPCPMRQSFIMTVYTRWSRYNLPEEIQ
jgi:hypothetical protein